MQSNKKFTELLEKYLAGSVTNTEYWQLMQLIKSGRYDEELKKKIDTSMSADSPAYQMDETRSEELLKKILNSEKLTEEIMPVMKPRTTARRWYAAAAIIAILFSIFGLLVYNNNSPVSEVAKNETTDITQAPDSSGKKYIRLPDGSTVLLNEGSKLEYADEFTATTREVTLTGEAYFDIKHDARRPFIVHTGKIKTTVLGTAFNIKAYPFQKEITVTVTRGKVKVSDERKTLGLITPNQSIAVNTESDQYSQQNVNAENMLQWKKQYLVLDDASLEEAAVIISNRYHVNISFTSEKIRLCRISATFLNNETLEQVLSVITGVLNAGYTIQPNDEVIINGDGCD